MDKPMIPVKKESTKDQHPKPSFNAVDEPGETREENFIHAIDGDEELAFDLPRD